MTKVVYKEKNVNGRAVFPSSAVVVVTRGRSETISILAPNAFLTFLEKFQGSKSITIVAPNEFLKQGHVLMHIAV